ncbi:PAS domain S-box protein [Phormidium pseudopriestleyi FRX01]|uniref:histidine kinase n=1 Tax=Phormidium pseudopriestleyi FRX01 TaxID=1759528 RepID=A0ABS3FLJ3_9CYAN|nr:PAS domain S-box protein [Phormidium pseudopriestleyi]MBO0347945.1 PAS domain S-box protein [Phormidium pseudopriestleyi FRX01]
MTNQNRGPMDFEAGDRLTQSLQEQLALAQRRCEAVELALEQMQAELTNAQTRQETAAASPKSAELYQNIFENAPIGMVLISLETQAFVEVNPTFCNLLGYSDSELATLTFGEITVPDNREKEGEFLLQRDERPEIFSYQTEQRLIRKNGEILWVHLCVSVLEDSQGNPLYLLGTIQDDSDRLRTQCALQESQERLANVLDTLPLGVWITDAEGTIIQGNPAGQKIWGGVRYVGMDSYHEYKGWWPDTGEQLSSEEWALSRTLRTGESILNEEIDIEDFNGKRKTILNSTMPLRNQSGVMVGAIFVNQDITQQRLVENALWENQRLIQQIAEATPTILYVYDLVENRNIYSNQHLNEILGYLPQEVQKMGPNFLPNSIHPEDWPRVVDNRLKLMSSKDEEIIETEYRMRDAQGEWHWLVSRDTIFARTQEGAAKQILGMGLDISLRKRAEAELAEYRQQLEALVQRRTAELQNTNQQLEREIADRIRAELQLRESETRYRLLAENATDMITTHTPSGVYQYVSPSCFTLLGYHYTELIGHLAYEWIHPDDIPKVENSHRAVLEALMPFQIVYRIRHKDGHYIWFETNAQAICHQETGEVVKIQAASRDISDRQRIEKELAQHTADLAHSNADLEQFAYIASHDLQEPLRMVASYTQLLARRYPDKLDAQGDKYMAYILDGATRMQQLINDLLQYSRVGTHGKSFDVVDCHEIMRQAISNLKLAIRQSEARITGQNLPKVFGDKTQLLQLFQNLIANAIKYRGLPPPEVQIEARDIEGEWLFSVKDNGIGIDPKYGDRIFQIFQRLHTREEYPGTGIGLAICKRIVERHRGHIWVESEPDRGAIFYFILANSSPIEE